MFVHPQMGGEFGYADAFLQEADDALSLRDFKARRRLQNHEFVKAQARWMAEGKAKVRTLADMSPGEIEALEKQYGCPVRR